MKKQIMSSIATSAKKKFRRLGHRRISTDSTLQP
jgi:hypothetical protein